ncbi:MAG: hypothetical protein U1E49_14920 [Hyphomicrobiaceae bacterium]
MSTVRTMIVASLAMASLQALAGSPAQAKIRCDGPYQIVGGSSLPTPYCEDNYLAAVARGYGIGVSGAAIRHNFNTKQHVCYQIGHDIRVASICSGMRPEDRSKLLVP